MAKRKFPITVTAIALITIGLALTLTTLAAISISKSFSSSGTISASPNLGIYSDSACTTAVTSLNWGTLNAGNTATQTIYIKNTGSGASLSLSMTTLNWDPTTANGPITITWDKEGTRLLPGQSTTAAITIAVSPSIVDITSFSVQVSITGTN